MKILDQHQFTALLALGIQDVASVRRDGQARFGVALNRRYDGRGAGAKAEEPHRPGALSMTAPEKNAIATHRKVQVPDGLDYLLLLTTAQRNHPEACF